MSAILVFQLLWKYPGLQPGQKLLAERTEHPGLREMDVAVDEAGQDQPVPDGRDVEGVVPPDHVPVWAEIGDPAVLDHQQPIAMKARRLLLAPDMVPRIIDEIE